MYRKGNVAVVLALSLAISLACLNGCASKKKIEEPPKKEVKVKAPEKKPAPRPQVKAPVKKTDETLPPRDLAFETVYFDFDKSDIKSDMRSLISRNAQLLSRYKTIKVRLEGHCDERGTNEYNMALGQRRADSVQRYFTDYGIQGLRINTISYGEERPAAAGHNETAWTKNRRCEIIITAR